MEVVSGNTLLPGDPRLIDHIVCELKSQGIFDQFRKECIADVDTKPAYQNLRQRVEGSVTGFLKTQTWKPDMNKNQLREMLRKDIYESGFLETGVERIVNQVVNPKINTVFLPQVEEVVYKFLGIDKPRRDSLNGPLSINTADLLPTDLDPISPDLEILDKAQIKTVVNNETEKLDDSKNDDFESPPFEPINEQTVFSPHEESSNDSHVSGISGLTSHDSNDSNTPEKILACAPETQNQDSQLSKVSSNSRLSIITNESKHTSEKMDISDDNSSKNASNSENGVTFNLKQDFTDELEAIKQELNKEQIEEKTNSEENIIKIEEKVKIEEKEEIEEKGKIEEIEKIEEKGKIEEIKMEETKNSDEVKMETEENLNEILEEPIKEIKQEFKEEIETVPEVAKEKIEEEKKIEEPVEVKVELKKPETKTEKSEKSRHESSDRKRSKYPDKKEDKDKKSEKDRKDKYRSSSSSSSSKDKYRDKSKDSKSKDSKETSRSKDDKDRSKDDRNKSSSSSSKHSSRERSSSSKTESSKSSSSKDRSDSRSRSSKDSKSKSEESRSKNGDDKSKNEEDKSRNEETKPKNDEDQSKNEENKSKSEDSKSKLKEETKSRNGDEKSKSKMDDSKSKSEDSKSRSSEDSKSRRSDSKSVSSSRSRDHSRSGSSKRSSHDRKSSSSSRDHRKDSKKSSKRDKEENCSAKEKKPETRRSADRDSNDGSSAANVANNQTSTKELSSSSSKSKSENSDSSQTSNSGESGQSDQVQTCPVNSTKTPVKILTVVLTREEISISPRRAFEGSVPAKVEDTIPQPLKLKKPRFASNIFEARRLMKVRKKLERLEKKRAKQLELSAKDGGDSSSVDSVDSEMLQIVQASELISEQAEADDNLDSSDADEYTEQELENLLSSKGSNEDLTQLESTPKTAQINSKSITTKPNKTNSTTSKITESKSTSTKTSKIMDSKSNTDSKTSKTPSPKITENLEIPVTAVISKASWDEIEEKFNKTVDFDSYMDDNSSSDSKPEVIQNVRKSSDEEDCLYFNPKVSPTTTRFLKKVESLQKIGVKLTSSPETKDPEVSAMAPPELNADRPPKRARKSNMKNIILDTDDAPITKKKIVETKLNNKRIVKGRKRKSDEGDMEYLENNNKKMEDSLDEDENDDCYIVNPVASASTRGNGKINHTPKSKPLTRAKRAKKNSTSDSDSFSMPLSPESDISSASSVEIKKQNDTPRPKRTPRAPPKKTQRYSSDDLYKPRPFLISTTRRQRGLLKNAGKL